MNRHPNFELVRSLVVLPDGSLTSWEHDRQLRLPWGSRTYLPNSNPGRRKFCPWCFHVWSINYFICEGPARTVVIGDYAYVMENVREWCHECDARVPRDFKETTCLSD